MKEYKCCRGGAPFRRTQLATRWLEIAEVQPDWYVLAANAGFPDGLRLHWRCRVSWVAPCEFLSWQGLLAAVRYQLEMSRLELRSVACSRERLGGNMIRLWVLVGTQRAGAGARAGARAENEHPYAEHA